MSIFRQFIEHFFYHCQVIILAPEQWLRSYLPDSEDRFRCQFELWTNGDITLPVGAKNRVVTYWLPLSVDNMNLKWHDEIIAGFLLDMAVL
jgi:hypothetical protein